MSIPFTQWLLPDGRPRRVTIDRAPEVEAKAREMMAVGLSLEAEVLRTGEVPFHTRAFTMEVDDGP